MFKDFDDNYVQSEVLNNVALKSHVQPKFAKSIIMAEYRKRSIS